jgi:hypothetical protein
VFREETRLPQQFCNWTFWNLASSALRLCSHAREQCVEILVILAAWNAIPSEGRPEVPWAQIEFGEPN